MQSTKRIYEHKQYIKLSDNQNALFSNMLDLKQTFSFSKSTLIKSIPCKKSHRLLESVVISKTKHINELNGLFKVSPYLADIILHVNNIKIENGLKNSNKGKKFFW